MLFLRSDLIVEYADILREFVACEVWRVTNGLSDGIVLVEYGLDRSERKLSKGFAPTLNQTGLRTDSSRCVERERRLCTSASLMRRSSPAEHSRMYKLLLAPLSHSPLCAVFLISTICGLPRLQDLLSQSRYHQLYRALFVQDGTLLIFPPMNTSRFPPRNLASGLVIHLWP